MKTIAEKYNWLKYEQVEDNFWLVLRRYLDQYVVHLYNLSDDGHYYGQYFGQDLDKAESAYQAKLATYQENNRPDHLMEVLEIIRANGACNMSDLDCICNLLNQSRYKFLADYLKRNQDNFHTILQEFAEWKANQPARESKSLAQQLADEMGWQVIID